MCSLRLFRISALCCNTSPSGTGYLVTLALSAALLYSIHKYLIRGGAEATGGGCWDRSPLLILDSEWASGRGPEAFAH